MAVVAVGVEVADLRPR